MGTSCKIINKRLCRGYVLLQGVSWEVVFNKLGDVLGPYEYRQFYSYRPNKNKETVIGMWDTKLEILSIYDENSEWDIFWENNHPGNPPWFRNTSDPPDSVCSRPCPPRQYYQQRELTCCWDCISCRNNEILVSRIDGEEISDGLLNGCLKCPEFYWPEEQTATFCERIQPV